MTNATLEEPDRIAKINRGGAAGFDEVQRVDQKRDGLVDGLELFALAIGDDGNTEDGGDRDRRRPTNAHVANGAVDVVNARNGVERCGMRKHALVQQR